MRAVHWLLSGLLVLWGWRAVTGDGLGPFPLCLSLSPPPPHALCGPCLVLRYLLDGAAQAGFVQRNQYTNYFFDMRQLGTVVTIIVSPLSGDPPPWSSLHGLAGGLRGPPALPS